MTADQPRQDEPRDREVFVHGEPVPVTRTELAALMADAFDSPADALAEAEAMLRIRVVTDDRIPPDTFVIGSPAAPSRVFMAPAGSPPGVSHDWVEVGTLASAPEWYTVESAASDEPIRRFRTDETSTLTLDATPRARDPYAYKRLPDAAPVDVWDVLLGEDFPGTRMAVHRAAMTRLAALCATASGVRP